MNRTVALFHTALGAAFWVATLAAFSVLGRPLFGQQSNEPVEVRIVELEPTPAGVSITLRAVNSRESIHMLIGLAEGESIVQAMRGRRPPRPMTHDLLKNLLLGLNVHVHKVVVSELKDDTFYALIWMEKDGQVMSVDSRPSDALALALRVDCPIFVEDEVLKNSKISSAISEKSTSEELRKWLEGLSDEDLGRYKM